MNKSHIFIAIFIFAGVEFVLSASAQVTAVRTLPERGYFPGVSIHVAISVGDLSSDATLTETPPAGWTISRVSATGKVTDRAITWNLRKRTFSYICTYIATPPETTSGDAAFSGKIGDQDTGGMTTVRQGTPEPIGIFQNHADYGFVDHSEVDYDSQTGEYRIKVGESPDSFEYGHFLYRKVYGDCSLQAHVHAENPDESYNAIAVLHIRDSLSIDNYLSVQIETKVNGQCWASWLEGSYTGFSIGDVSDYASANNFDGRLRIERNGDLFSMYYFNTQTEEWKLTRTFNLSFRDPAYIGFYVWSGNGETTGTFKDVELTIPSSVEEWELY
ncbi:MAG: DUF1349 domain-containing protein [bacterium]